MSLSEQFIQHYLNDKNCGADDICRKEEAEILCEKLKLEEEGSTGFVLTKTQFEHLSNSFAKYAAQSMGLYRLQFHPKSGHIIHGHMSGYSTFDVYPTRGLSANFEYFRWSFNGLFCKDWIKFNEKIKYTNCEYIVIKHGEDFDTLLCSYDPVENECHLLGIHMGGGRPYCEEVAVPYEIIDGDVVVDGVVEPVYTKCAVKK